MSSKDTESLLLGLTLEGDLRRPQTANDIVLAAALAARDMYGDVARGIAEQVVYSYQGIDTLKPIVSPRELIETVSQTATDPSSKNSIAYGARLLIVMFGLAYDPNSSFADNRGELWAGATTALARERMRGWSSDDVVSYANGAFARNPNKPVIPQEDVALLFMEIGDVLLKTESEPVDDDKSGHPIEAVPMVPEGEITTGLMLAEPRNISVTEHLAVKEMVEKIQWADNRGFEEIAARELSEDGKPIATVVDLTGLHSTLFDCANDARKFRSVAVDNLLAMTVRRAAKGNAHLAPFKIADKSVLVGKTRGSNDRLLRVYLLNGGCGKDGLPVFALIGLSRTKGNQENTFRVLQGGSAPTASRLR